MSNTQPQHFFAFDQLQSRLRITGTLSVTTGLRIGTGGDTGISSTRLPVMRDTFDRPFIPGASFKGALRSLLEAIVRGLGTTLQQQRRLACMVLTSEERCISNYKMDEWRKRDAKNDPRKLSELVYEHSCLLCQTFGSPWMASHIAVSDLLVDPELWYGQFEVRQGVAISRDTETAANSLLYDFEVVPAETRFRLDIACDNLAEWQRGLLWLGMQRFVDGEVAIGGGRSRGLGKVKLVSPTWDGWELGSDRVASILNLVSTPWQSIPTQTMPIAWRAALEQRLKEAMRV